MQAPFLMTLFILVSAAVLFSLASALRLAHNQKLDRAILAKRLTQKIGLSMALLIFISIGFFTVLPKQNGLTISKKERNAIHNQPYNISAHKKTPWPSDMPMRA
jgi:hypothetical protein